MVKEQYGRIINIGSVLGLVGYQQFASYSTSKGALMQLTRTLRYAYVAAADCVSPMMPALAAAMAS